MGGWIKFWKDMADDPRLIEAAKLIASGYHLARKTSSLGGEDLSAGDALRFASNALRGALVTLWCYADEHIRNDDTLPIHSDTLDAFVGIEGFFDMIPRDWVTKLDDGTVKLPSYCEKNGLIAKEKRALDNKARQAAWRARNNAKRNGTEGEHNQNVTRNTSVTKCVDLDSDLDQDFKKKNQNVSAGQTPPTRKTIRKVPRETDPDWWLDFKLAYPERAGDPNWRGAVRASRARLAEGHTAAEMIAGAKRYAAFCEATGKVGTEYVKQASAFLGLGKPFLLPWSIPPPQKSGDPVLTWRPPAEDPEYC